MRLDRQLPKQPFLQSFVLDGEIVAVPGFLSAGEAEDLRARAARAPLEDGRASSGDWGAELKRNLQVKPPAMQDEGASIISRIFDHEKLAATFLLKAAMQPTFSIYRTGSHYASHQDSAIQAGIRADLSFTLFLSKPEAFRGGGLRLGERDGLRPPAGTLVMYPSGTPHAVEPVEEGERVVAVGWMQSYVRSSRDRALLAAFFTSLSAARSTLGPDSAAFIGLNAIRTELMRRWVEA